MKIRQLLEEFGNQQIIRSPSMTLENMNSVSKSRIKAIHAEVMPVNPPDQSTFILMISSVQPRPEAFRMKDLIRRYLADRMFGFIEVLESRMEFNPATLRHKSPAPVVFLNSITNDTTGENICKKNHPPESSQNTVFLSFQFDGGSDSSELWKTAIALSSFCIVIDLDNADPRLSTLKNLDLGATIVMALDWAYIHPEYQGNRILLDSGLATAFRLLDWKQVLHRTIMDGFTPEFRQKQLSFGF